MLWEVFSSHGHLQVVSNMVDFGMNPQEALDKARFRISIEDEIIFAEDSFDQAIISGLKSKGHSVSLITGVNRGFFGGGQIINRITEGVLIGGSDPRKDGLSVSY